MLALRKQTTSYFLEMSFKKKTNTYYYVYHVNSSLVSKRNGFIIIYYTYIKPHLC